MLQRFQKGNQINKGRIPWNKGLKTPEDVTEKQRDAKLKNPVKYWLGKQKPYESELKRIERRIGGFWYGNVRYDNEPQYCEKFTEELKERCRAFWGYVCFECGTPQTTRKLHVHHVHYNKKTCCDGSPSDMVPLCQSHHMQSNADRDRWEKHLTELLYERSPTGKCFFTREEMQIYMTSKSIITPQGAMP